MKHAISIVLVLLSALIAERATARDEEFTRKISERLGRTIDTVSPTGIAGFFEVVADGKIIYVDRDASHAFSGQIIDLKTKENLTRTSLDKLHVIRFADLPFAKAIITQRGNGRNRIAIFTDPTCRYCRKLEPTINSLTNVKIYRFLYPVLSEDSQILSCDIWCSTNRIETWDKWIDKRQRPTEKLCDSTNTEMLLLGKTLHINATPTMFFVDGSRLVGAVSPEIIQEKLNKISH